MNALMKQRPSGVTQLIPPFAEVTPTSLHMPEDLPEANWRETGLALGRVRSASQWWVGDWWAFGEHRYGERKATVEAEDWEGPAFQTCMDVGIVCNAFTTSRRREVLSFTAHREVLSLPAEWQDKLLDEAIRESYTTRQIRDRVKQIRATLAQGWSPDQLDRKARCEAGECVVANMRDDGNGKRADEALLCWAEMEDRFVRVDRASKWGNPFEMPGDGDRNTVCTLFERFYWPHKAGLLKQVHTLAGKVCGCWCHPEPCHGHTIAETANRVCQGEDAAAVVDELAGVDG